GRTVRRLRITGARLRHRARDRPSAAARPPAFGAGPDARVVGPRGFSARRPRTAPLLAGRGGPDSAPRGGAHELAERKPVPVSYVSVRPRSTHPLPVTSTSNHLA